MKTEIVELIRQASENFVRLEACAPVITQIAYVWLQALKQDNKIIFCGNGGSAADSQHLAAELVGRYKFDRNPLPALSLTTDTSALTAIGNDYGFDMIFSRQLAGLGRPGDVLVGISTSGNSPDVLNALATAGEMNIHKIAFTGQDGGKCRRLADICLTVPASITNSIQEMHIACGHILCGLVEQRLFKK